MSLNELYKMSAFSVYYETLAEWNQKFNLTSLTEREDVYLKHFYDSILPADLIPQGSTLLDIGSGAGFPGVCLKLVRPDLNVTLLDSVGKKIIFLEALISRLELTGIRAVKSRIEDFSGKGFDVVTARAVAPANILAEYCLPFVKKGGFCILYKSTALEAELNSAKKAISLLGGKTESIITRKLSEDILRTFIIIRKTGITPEGYPRKGNKPRLNPL